MKAQGGIIDGIDFNSVDEKSWAVMIMLTRVLVVSLAVPGTLQGENSLRARDAFVLESMHPRMLIEDV